MTRHQRVRWLNRALMRLDAERIRENPKRIADASKEVRAATRSLKAYERNARCTDPLSDNLMSFSGPTALTGSVL